MPRKIFVRECLHIPDGDQRPKYRIVVIIFCEDRPFVQVKMTHLRKEELERIAADIQAEIVYLEPNHGHPCPICAINGRDCRESESIQD